MIKRQQFSQRGAIAFPLSFSTPSYDKAFLQALKNLHGTRLRAGWCPLVYALQYAMPDLTANVEPVSRWYRTLYVHLPCRSNVLRGIGKTACECSKGGVSDDDKNDP